MERKRDEARDGGEVVGTEALDEGGRDGPGAGASRDSEFSALLVRYFDATVGPRHDQFAALVAISPAQLSRYRYGHAVPQQATKSRFAEKVGISLEWFEAMTADVLCMRGRSGDPADGQSAKALAETLTRRLVGQLAPRLAALRSMASPAVPPPPSLERAAADRTEAADRWAEIEPLTAAERSFMVPEIPAFYSWVFVELLCAKSAEAAVAPADAVALARLAVKLARRVQASQGFRDRLMGYALLHMAKALRAANDLSRAREARARGMRLFEAGRAEDPGLLDETTVEGLAAS